MFYFPQGNLFEYPKQVLVNPVNCFGISGKGLAKQFAKIFTINQNNYELACIQGKLKPGEIFVTDTLMNIYPNYIINAATKNHWRNSSKPEYIQNIAKEINNFLLSYNIESIAIPPIGAGLGKLEKTQVKEILLNTLKNNPSNIYLYNF